MKCVAMMLAAALFLGTVCGCGNKNESDNSTAAAAPGKAETAPAANQMTAVKTADPKDAVNKFLAALQSGDEKTAEALLTNKAREETARQNMVVQPPGTPNATYEVGRVEHPEGQPNAAYVSCIWSEKYDDGEQDSYEVVWVLRKETEGWRVAGMFTQLDETLDPVLLNFENPVEMLDKVREAEMASHPTETAQAAAPHGPATSQDQPDTVIR